MAVKVGFFFFLIELDLEPLQSNIYIHALGSRIPLDTPSQFDIFSWFVST